MAIEIKITLESTLEMEALESALDMFAEWAKETRTDVESWTARDRACAEAGLELLKRVRHGGK